MTASSPATPAVVVSALPFEALSAAVLERIASLATSVTVAADAVIYEAGADSGELYVVEAGAVRLEPLGQSGIGASPHVIRPGEAFGWMALAESASRRNRAVAVTATRLLRLPGSLLLDLVGSDPASGPEIRERIAAAISAIRRPPDPVAAEEERYAALSLMIDRTGQWFRSPAPYLMLLGYALLLGFWYVSVEALKLPRFAEMPGLTTVFQEWISPTPTYGVSLFTPVYYQHILVSLQRIAIAFVLATALGVPVGLLLGWSRAFREYVFPVFEVLRPIPILAWVPLAIIMLPGSELPVLYLTFLASFFATALNTMLGVRSIDPVYLLAAESLGASPLSVFRHVVIPAALPFIFTGLQISVGVAWFSLVAAEMVSGQFGLGYLINTSYTTVQYPTIIIAMITLGAVGYGSSVLVRLAGDWLMVWQVRQLAMDEAR